MKERDEKLWRAAPWTPSRVLTWGKEKHGTVLGRIKAWNADLCCVGESRGWEGRTSREGWSRAHGVKAGETNSGLSEAGVKPPSVDKKTLMLWKWWEPRERRGGRSHWLGEPPGQCLSEVTESRAESYTVGWVSCIEEVMLAMYAVGERQLPARNRIKALWVVLRSLGSGSSWISSWRSSWPEEKKNVSNLHQHPGPCVYLEIFLLKPDTER